MSATPDQLPNDIEEMKQLFLAQSAHLEKLTAELAAASTQLATASAELDAAKAGLKSYALEIEKLKFQLARLRSQRYGSSSERIEREIAQLELRPEYPPIFTDPQFVDLTVYRDVARIQTFSEPVALTAMHTRRSDGCG